MEIEMGLPGHGGPAPAMRIGMSQVCGDLPEFAPTGAKVTAPESNSTPACVELVKLFTQMADGGIGTKAGLNP